MANTQGIVHDTRKGKLRRSLLDHLQGTQTLLHQAGYPEALCTAGLLHSVYGTNKFTHKSIDPTIERHRDLVRLSAGVEAERLAFLFHSIKRPRVLHEFVRREHRGDHERVRLEGRDGEDIEMTEGEAWQLVALELANLLEQAEYSEATWPDFKATEAYHRIAPKALPYCREKYGGHQAAAACSLQ